MVPMTNTVDFKTVGHLGGKAEIVSFDYAGLDFQVPEYPGIVREYRNEDNREGYLIQLIPGEGFRFIYTELPEWEIGPDGKERQLEAPDEFGPVVPTLESAMASALENLAEEGAIPSVASWAMKLDRDLKSMRRDNIVRNYSEDGFGYLIQETPNGYFRLVIIGEGEDETSPELPSLSVAIKSAHGHWRAFGVGGDEAYSWSRELARDAKVIREPKLSYAEVVSIIGEGTGDRLTLAEIESMASRIVALAGS